ncbi:hypothetical protein B0H15DRAFT_492879 [Mycena belliarum]|uniref:DUF1365-domain-containing protein n=1 Tax=Mycena belliarum TaxID=1033014 RepID=A0AAD6TWI9_9AGAR|nr:hypothetical protein B0H15DRAFT_492879 [Mycena belliae]
MDASDVMLFGQSKYRASESSAALNAGMSIATLPRGYVLENQVTHARLLPLASKHAFTYPTLALLLSLNALEDHSLDLSRGWVFGYGGRWGRLSGLRADPYLCPTDGSLRQRLEKVILDRGFTDRLGDAWIMTMPSLLGFEGINPLTVYFCYSPEGALFLTVLEVHNTFGEAHVYCLEPGKREDKAPSRGFDHQWTFPRMFHVSPFNDRSGFYTVSVTRPSHPPSGVPPTTDPTPPPRPNVRVHLHTASADPTVSGPLKLAALLRPSVSTPLTTPALLSALSRTPFALFLSFARIAYVAWILHYVKRLDVFPRPPPLPHPSLSASSGAADTIRHLPAGALEEYAQRRVKVFLTARASTTHITITLVPADPALNPITFAPKDSDPPLRTLRIHYAAPLFFAALLRAPSPQHALRLGAAERLFSVNDASLFCTVFSAPTAPTQRTGWRQRLRATAVEGSLAASPVPPRHALDAAQSTFFATLLDALVLCALLALDRLEAGVFSAARARVVRGMEPWKMWERAAREGGDGVVEQLGTGEACGSVRREE